MADSNNGVADPDPIASTYDVYIKPNVSNSRQVYILQFPNRDPNRPYSASHNAQPLKLRIKPQAGMLELDVPIDAWQNYDKEKGLKWGEAMKKSTKAGQTHGMPGGFGIGGTLPGTGRGRPAAQEAPVDPQRLLDDYEGAIQREQVLTKQTLGGQTAPKEKWAPQYMVGAFYKDQLHLTPVSEMVQMRPQFHHIDAHLEQEKIGRASGQATRVTEQRAVHQVAKAANDGEDETTESMAERIASAQGESWRGHRYIDEDSNEAWNAFHEDLFVVAKELEKDDEEMPDVTDIKAEQGKGMSDTLKDKVPTLLSKSNNAQYLDEISAPTDQAKLSRSKKTRERRRKRDEKGKGKEGDAAVEDDSSSTLSGTDDEEQGVQIVESIPIPSSSSRREAKVEKT